MLFIIIFGTLPIPITGLRGVSICWLLRNQTLSIDHWTVKNAPRRHCDISNVCYSTVQTLLTTRPIYGTLAEAAWRCLASIRSSARRQQRTLAASPTPRATYIRLTATDGAADTLPPRTPAPAPRTMYHRRTALRRRRRGKFTVTFRRLLL